MRLSAGLLVSLLLVSGTLQVCCQKRTNPVSSACGAEEITFRVTAARDHSRLLPAGTKANVYVLQDILDSPTLGASTTRIGMDGKWLGANRKRSYSAFTINAGLHHICVDWYDNANPRSLVLYRLDAVPGGVYYLRTRLLSAFPGATAPSLSEAIFQLDMQMVDADEGEFLLDTLDRSSSQPERR